MENNQEELILRNGRTYFLGNEILASLETGDLDQRLANIDAFEFEEGQRIWSKP